jgi:hypothetical protein
MSVLGIMLFSHLKCHIPLITTKFIAGLQPLTSVLSDYITLKGLMTTVNVLCRVGQHLSFVNKTVYFDMFYNKVVMIL